MFVLLVFPALLPCCATRTASSSNLQVPHLPVPALMGVSVGADLIMIAFALNRFHRKTVS
jgi:hypothetical protein